LPVVSLALKWSWWWPFDSPVVSSRYAQLVFPVAFRHCPPPSRLTSTDATEPTAAVAFPLSQIVP
jgi:hypothetical protein